MSELEAFLKRCETPIECDNFWQFKAAVNDISVRQRRLVAMVRLMKKEICLLDNCSKCGHHDQYLCEHYDTMQELDKIARGEAE